MAYPSAGADADRHFRSGQGAATGRSDPVNKSGRCRVDSTRRKALAWGRPQHRDGPHRHRRSAGRQGGRLDGAGQRRTVSGGVWGRDEGTALSSPAPMMDAVKLQSNAGHTLLNRRMPGTQATTDGLHDLGRPRTRHLPSVSGEPPSLRAVGQAQSCAHCMPPIARYRMKIHTSNTALEVAHPLLRVVVDSDRGGLQRNPRWRVTSIRLPG